MADMGMSAGPSGLDRGTPLPETDRPGHVAPMGDMEGMQTGGMEHGGGAQGGTNHAAMGHAMPGQVKGGGHAGMDHAAMGHSMPGAGIGQPPMDHAAMGHAMPMTSAGMIQNMPAKGVSAGESAMANQNGPNHAAMGHGGMAMPDPIEQDTGAPPGAKVLSYRDLKALNNPYGWRAPDRIVEVRLTGNMERYFWSINGNKFSEAQPLVFRHNERVRLRFVNETMMNHPMHIHGMWMIPDAGNGDRNPLKHVVNIKPGTTLDVDVVAELEGGWAFHCHLLYHMETGMMREVRVVRARASL